MCGKCAKKKKNKHTTVNRFNSIVLKSRKAIGESAHLHYHCSYHNSPGEGEKSTIRTNTVKEAMRIKAKTTIKLSKSTGLLLFAIYFPHIQYYVLDLYFSAAMFGGWKRKEIPSPFRY